MNNSYSNRPGRQTMFNMQPTDYVPFETSARMPIQMMPMIASCSPAPGAHYQGIAR